MSLRSGPRALGANERTRHIASLFPSVSYTLTPPKTEQKASEFSIHPNFNIDF